MIRIRRFCVTAMVLILGFSTSFADELSSNVGITNNYIWRGLTQTENQAAISGGLEWSAENGLYIGAWVSNVSYAPNDAFSYENDIYFGYSGAVKKVDYDLGYLYYNYDPASNFDFGELYGSLSYAGVTVGGYLLANTQANAENPEQEDFGFGEAYYGYVDYEIDIRDGLMLGFHVGHHSGDFNKAFNAVPGSYNDFNISLSKKGFSFMITDTDLDDPDGIDSLDNDELKFVASYVMEFEL